MYIVGPREITTNEIIELREICKRMELGHFLLARNIYKGIYELEKIEDKTDTTWLEGCAISSVLAYGYRLGVQAERNKHKSKKIIVQTPTI